MTVCRTWVVMATYNPEREFLARQIESLRGQSFKDWHCLVVDDHSAEERFALVRELIGGDTRFSVIRNLENRGVNGAFEMGLQAVPDTAEYVLLCDQDDVWEREKIDCLKRALEENTETNLVHSDLSLIDAAGRQLAPSCWQAEGRSAEDGSLEALLFRNQVTGASCLFRASVLRHALPFPSFLIGKTDIYHDHWLALNAACTGVIRAVPRPLVKYRQHENNQVGALRAGRGVDRTLFSRAQRFVKVRLVLSRELAKRHPSRAIPDLMGLSALHFGLRGWADLKTLFLLGLGRVLAGRQGL